MIRTIVLLALAATSVPLVEAALASPTGPCARPTDHCPAVKTLLERREGYGERAVGGLGGVFVDVTSSADEGSGTLRAALEAPGGPRWVRFASDMSISLSRQLRAPSDVTIDGRGRAITLLDHGVSVLGARNVILTHLTIDGRLRTFGQAVDIANGSRDVWVNHLDLSRFNDRLMNVKNGSTDVTVSWVKFHDHNKVMLINNLTSENLFAHHERDSIARVSMFGNWFVNTVQRNPRVVLGIAHFYNNLLEDWDLYGMSFSLEAKILVEGNVFSNTRARGCVEPSAFVTTHGVSRNYCDKISRSPQTAFLRNGASDEKAYAETAGRFGYMRDSRAFVLARDNLPLGDVQLVDVEHRPDRAPSVPYCYAYWTPSPALADMIRLHAGVRPDAPAAPRRCRAGAR